MSAQDLSDLRLLGSPEYCPGGYCLHLYCKYENPAHRFDEFPWEIAQVETGAEARRGARAFGWVLHRDGTATCPKCAALLKAKIAEASDVPR